MLFRVWGCRGSLPSPDHVPRLMEQLIIVQNLWQVLCQEGISAVSRIQRDEFEGGLVGRAGAALAARIKDAGLIGEDELFARFHFVFEFSAREQALISVLNRLASHKLFIVVTNMDIIKSGPDIREPAPVVADEEAPQPAEGGEVAAPPVLQRTVCGRTVEEPMRVTLEIDVYRFREKEGDS